MAKIFKKSIYKIIPVLFIFILELLAYSNTFWVPFQFDDFPSIVNNSTITSLYSIKDIFKFQPTRFVVMYSFALDYAVHGNNVFGYHLVNFAIHFIASLGVYWLALLLIKTPLFSNWLQKQKYLIDDDKKKVILWASCAGFIFVSHPIQTEAVTYIWQRNTSLSAFFYILSLCFFIKHRLLINRNDIVYRSVYFLFSIIFTIFGMFTKENTFTIPLAILFLEFTCFERYPFQRIRDRFLLCMPFLFTLIIIPLTTLLIGNLQLAHIHSPESQSTTPIYYFLTQLDILPRYLCLIFFPKGLSVVHDIEIISSIKASSITSSIFISGLIFLAWYLRRKAPYLIVGIIFFFLFNLIESTFIPLEDLMVEHRMYLSIVGVSIIVAGLFFHTFLEISMRSEKFKRLNMLTILLLMLLCFILISKMTYNQNQVWQTKESLWKNATIISPKNTRARTNLGNAYMEKRQYHKAIKHYRIAVDYNPDSLMDRWHYGSALVYAQKYDQAKEELIIIKNKFPDSILGDYGLGLLYLKVGQLSKSEEILIRVWEKIKSRHSKDRIKLLVLKNIAELYEEQKRFDEAKTILYDLLDIDDDNFSYYYQLVRIFIKQEDLNSAIKYYRQYFSPNITDEEIKKEFQKIFGIQIKDYENKFLEYDK